MPKIAVAKNGDIAPGSVRVVEAAGKRIALCNHEGTFFAIDDVCTHDRGPLDQGELIGFEIECPRHGARFDVRTGQATRLPAIMPVKTYPVTADGDEISVEVPE
jgi:3-phenylpropionate/trans-cinnamate dioxygenase ferredoxin subunit